MNYARRSTDPIYWSETIFFDGRPMRRADAVVLLERAGVSGSYIAAFMDTAVRFEGGGWWKSCEEWRSTDDGRHICISPPGLDPQTRNQGSDGKTGPNGQFHETAMSAGARVANAMDNPTARANVRHVPTIANVLWGGLVGGEHGESGLDEMFSRAYMRWHDTAEEDLPKGNDWNSIVQREEMRGNLKKVEHEPEKEIETESGEKIKIGSKDIYTTSDETFPGVMKRMMVGVTAATLAGGLATTTMAGLLGASPGMFGMGSDAIEGFISGVSALVHGEVEGLRPVSAVLGMGGLLMGGAGEGYFWKSGAMEKMMRPITVVAALPVLATGELAHQAWRGVTGAASGALHLAKKSVGLAAFANGLPHEQWIQRAVAEVLSEMIKKTHKMCLDNPDQARALANWQAGIIGSRNGKK